MKSTYQARKPVKVGDGWRVPGQLVPEAAIWFRVDHLVHSGFLTRTMVEDDVWEEAVQRYCPDLHEALTAQNKESQMQDTAAQRAYQERILMATDPRRALTERHAAPPNTLDASRSDAEAAAALRAASLEAQATKIATEAEEKLSSARREAADAGAQIEAEEVEVEGASEQFASDNIERDERTEEYETGLRQRTRTPREARGDGEQEPAKQEQAKQEQAKREQKDPAKRESAKQAEAQQRAEGSSRQQS